MANWKQMIVGDAFRVPSRDFNFYRDSLLVWPFLLFTIAALANLSSRSSGHRSGLEFAALSVVSLALARERFALIGGALGFCAVQSLLFFFLRHEQVGLWIGTITGALFLVLVRSFKNYRPSYEWPESLSIATVLLSLLSLGFTLLVFRWIGR